MADLNIKLLLSLATGPLIALTLAGIISIFINAIGDPLITVGAATKIPDIRPLSEIVGTCILAPIPLWSFVGLILFVISNGESG